MDDFYTHSKQDLFLKQKTLFQIYKTMVFFSGLLLSSFLIFATFFVVLVSPSFHQPYLAVDAFTDDYLVTSYLLHGDEEIFSSVNITSSEILFFSYFIRTSYISDGTIQFIFHVFP